MMNLIKVVPIDDEVILDADQPDRRVANGTVLRSVMGYEFLFEDERWKLSKDTSLNVSLLMSRIPSQHRGAAKKMMVHYATTFSGGTVLRLAAALHDFFSKTSGDISTTQLINYKSGLADNEHLMQLRPFFRRWLNFRLPGVTKEVVSMLDSWRLAGREKGLAVKTLDPRGGPLSDFEHSAFNEGLTFSYEAGEIDLYELCVCLIISTTGRRPIQLTHLKCGDLVDVVGSDGVINYFLHIPRAKQHGSSFRDEFKTYQLTREMYDLLNSHREKLWRDVDLMGYRLSQDHMKLLPLFPAKRSLPRYGSTAELMKVLPGERLHVVVGVFTQVMKRAVESLGIVSDRTGDLLEVFARRFRYSLGTRAAREGVSKFVIAELLDHSDTQHVDTYTLNVPEHLKKIDEALGFQLAVYAQAFTGNLVDTELDALRGSDPASRIKHKRSGVGTCGNFSYCGMNVPRPCYTCVNFQPWLDGPHDELYFELLDERERIMSETGDLTMAAILDRTIVAVAQVIMRCSERKKEMACE